VPYSRLGGGGGGEGLLGTVVCGLGPGPVPRSGGVLGLLGGVGVGVLGLFPPLAIIIFLTEMNDSAHSLLESLLFS
jgi:hypothetical protein